MRLVIVGSICLMLATMIAAPTQAGPAKWTEQQANAWYEKQPWIFGFNFVPSTAVNDTEIWQKDTFDPKTIDRELAWAEGLGFSSCRIFVQYIVWKQDPKGLKKRFGQLLEIAAKRHISVMPVLFDDCAFDASGPLPRQAGRSRSGDIQCPLGAKPRPEAGGGQIRMARSGEVYRRHGRQLQKRQAHCPLGPV